ncbi:unnamed protein product [marine sediment metagenome]|uniref:Uncharacterized protein n=1 Tax=marine sediment metagenome TaxID=412755 RepID=X0T5V6_9ZZZZ
MAITTFNIEHYKVSISHEINASWGGINIKAHGKVVCYGSEHRLFAYFLDSDTSSTKPMYIENDKEGVIFLPFNDMSTFIDILRNEKPVYGYLSSEEPEWNGIGTFRVPFGERES